MANQLQKLLLAAYPNVDLLPFDHADEQDVEAAVQDGRTGDTLFDFLWREMADHSGDAENALEALDHAMRDIRSVREAVFAALDAPRAPAA